MIYGIGTDICDIRRIEAVLERQGERFVRKVLSDAEIVVWQKRSARWPQRGMRFLATRFLQGDRPGHAHADDLARLRDRQPAQRSARHRVAR